MLAPGCRLHFSGPNGENIVLHGTSLAAPLVSFAAALVRSLGISSTQEVKARIVASADFDPTLRDDAHFSAIVNVERAAAVFQDSLRLKGSDRDLRGTWHSGDDLGKICPELQPLTQRRIRAIQSFQYSGVQKLRLISMAQDSRMSEPEECVPVGDGIDFQVENETSQRYAWEDIVTLVPAYPYPRP